MDVPETSPSARDNMSSTRKALIQTALCIVCILVYMDTVIVSTALPSISKDLHASSVQYAWVGSSYLLASASLLPLFASLSDIFGRKSMMLIGNALFLLGGLICALSNHVSMLIAGRVLQGTGGGGLLVLINICIADVFSLRERSLYLSILGAASAVSTSVAPLLGGAFTVNIGWQWCFWINLPFGGLSFVCLAAVLNLHNPKTPLLAGLLSIDWPGAIAISSATIMLLLGLQFGGFSHPWNSAVVISLIVAGVVTFGLSGVLQYLQTSPVAVIPLRAFARRTSVAALFVCFSHGFVLFGCLYYLSIYLQVVLGQSPIRAGLWMLAAAVPLSCWSIATGLFTKITGRYKGIISLSSMLMTIACGLFIDLTHYPSWARVVCFQIVLALGVGPLFQGPLVAVQSQNIAKDSATATSACSFFRMIGASIGLVIGQVLLSNHLQHSSENLRAAGIPDEVVAQLLKEFNTIGKSAMVKLNAQQRDLYLSTFNFGMRDIWIFYTSISFLALLSSLLIQHKDLSQDDAESRTHPIPESVETAEYDIGVPHVSVVGRGPNATQG